MPAEWRLHADGITGGMQSNNAVQECGARLPACAGTMFGT